MSKKQQQPTEDPVSRKGSSDSCSCISDPFASLPSELRPRPQPKKEGLRQVNCPGCGQEYWTNRETDGCIKCRNSGDKL